jgi:hypothetical protein
MQSLKLDESERDRMSEEQHKTKEAIEACGGIYYIAENFESFLVGIRNCYF